MSQQTHKQKSHELIEELARTLREQALRYLEHGSESPAQLRLLVTGLVALTTLMATEITGRDVTADSPHTPAGKSL